MFWCHHPRSTFAGKTVLTYSNARALKSFSKDPAVRIASPFALSHKVSIVVKPRSFDTGAIQISSSYP